MKLHLHTAALALLFCAAPAFSFSPVPPGNYQCWYRSDVDNTLQTYFLYVPTRYNPDKGAPLVLSMHGFGGRARAPGEGSVKDWADSEGWLLVDLDGRGSNNWDFIGEDDIFNVLSDLERSTKDHAPIRVDDSRVYVHGCSMGGHGSFRMAFRYPQKIAASAPGAGWTTYEEFYAHWYDAKRGPKMPDYVDPARRPVLETASSLWQAEHGIDVPMSITFDYNDWVNPPWNQERVLDVLHAKGHPDVEVHTDRRGHCGSFNRMRNLEFFRDKRRQGPPAKFTFTTNTVRYNTLHWLTVDRLHALNQWARIQARSNGSGVMLHTENVTALTLSLASSGVDMRSPITVSIDKTTLRVQPAEKLHFSAVMMDDHQIESWKQVELPAAAGKSRRLPGPLSEAFREPFTLVYGTHGNRMGATADNPDYEAAQRFATDWNNWMILHWGRQKPPPHRHKDWWIPPYPFQPGRHTPPDQPLVQPVPDTAFTLGSMPDRNIILFGDVSSNWLVSHMAPRLPLTPVGGRNPGIRVGDKTYKGDHVNYCFVAPNPLNPERYLGVFRGYLSSRIDPNNVSANKVGKDMEAMPFYWPDYVVWDARVRPGPTVQSPLRYLPDAFIEAGYFADDWQLDSAPPGTVAAERSGNTVVLTAADAPGGFGISRIEYAIDGGEWQQYVSPLEVSDGTKKINARAIDQNGRFIYKKGRGKSMPGNVGPTTNPLLSR
jgi:poly(3-hydroxybutyrate) depolymerase